MSKMRKTSWLLLGIAFSCMIYLTNARPAKQHVALAAQPIVIDARQKLTQNSASSTTTTSQPAEAHASQAKATRSYSRHSGTKANNSSLASRIACIVRVEHGGSYSRGNNPTHTGKYQFSYATWIAYGGQPGTWQTASPQEQDQVFNNAINSGGIGNWTNYDGC